MTRFRPRDLDGEDPYALLRVDRTADHDAIVSAYRRRVREVHPDLPSGSEETTKLLHIARDILLDPVQRAEYDRTVEPDGPATGYHHAPASSAWDGDDVVSGFVETPSFVIPPSAPPAPPRPPQWRSPPSGWYPPPPAYPAPPPLPLRVRTNLAMSIVALFFFWPLAIPAIVAASRAGSAAQAGDYRTAQREAADSRRWSRLAIIVGAVWLVLLATCCCLGYATSLTRTGPTR